MFLFKDLFFTSERYVMFEIKNIYVYSKLNTIYFTQKKWKFTEIKKKWREHPIRVDCQKIFLKNFQSNLFFFKAKQSLTWIHSLGMIRLANRTKTNVTRFECCDVVFAHFYEMKGKHWIWSVFCVKNTLWSLVDIWYFSYFPSTPSRFVDAASCWSYIHKIQST